MNESKAEVPSWASIAGAMALVGVIVGVLLWSVLPTYFHIPTHPRSGVGVAMGVVGARLISKKVRAERG
jgi:hypothetical protein